MTPERIATLTLVLDEVIPPGSDGRMPGAGELGLATQLASEEGLAPLLEAGLDALEASVREAHGTSFDGLPTPARRGALDRLGETQPAFVPTVVAKTIVAYYQDRRVMVALGLPGRAPYPAGFEVPETDFSILEPVRERGPFFRRPGASR